MSLRALAAGQGSALATMIELLAGPLIGDRTSHLSATFDQGHRAAPCHGGVIIAFDPALLSNADDLAAGAAVLDPISDQGARLPGARRLATCGSLREGIPVRRALYQQIRALMEV